MLCQRLSVTYYAWILFLKTWGIVSIKSATVCSIPVSLYPNQLYNYRGTCSSSSSSSSSSTCCSIGVSVGGFLADAGSLYDAEKVLLLCLSMCPTSGGTFTESQLLRRLDCCIRYTMPRPVLRDQMMQCCYNNKYSKYFDKTQNSSLLLPLVI